MIYDDNWIQVDFLRNVFAEGVVTQGRENSGQRVTSYHLQYKKNGQDQFKTIEDENNQPKVSVVDFYSKFILALQSNSSCCFS